MRLLGLIFCIGSALTTLAQQENEDFLMFSIYFGGGSYYISEDQKDELYDFINEIERIENYTISIHSHTDNIGPADWNRMLSERRGDAAIELLLEYNIYREVISKKDFGLHNPVYDNSTWYGRLKNRRVDIIFWPIVM